MTSHFDMTDKDIFKERLSALDSLIDFDPWPKPDAKCNSCGIEYYTAIATGFAVASSFSGFVCNECVRP